MLGLKYDLNVLGPGSTPCENMSVFSGNALKDKDTYHFKDLPKQSAFAEKMTFPYISIET